MQGLALIFIFFLLILNRVYLYLLVPVTGPFGCLHELRNRRLPSIETLRSSSTHNGLLFFPFSLIMHPAHAIITQSGHS